MNTIKQALLAGALVGAALMGIPASAEQWWVTAPNGTRSLCQVYRDNRLIECTDERALRHGHDSSFNHNDPRLLQNGLPGRDY